MFVKNVGKFVIILLVYADDIILVVDCEFEISKVIDFLKS